MKHYTLVVRLLLTFAFCLSLAGLRGNAQTMQPDTLVHVDTAGVSSGIEITAPNQGRIDTCDQWIFVNINVNINCPTVLVCRDPQVGQLCVFDTVRPNHTINGSTVVYAIGPLCPGEYIIKIVDCFGHTLKDATQKILSDTAHGIGSDTASENPAVLRKAISGFDRLPVTHTYPNPFSERTSINFYGTIAGRTTITVLNKTGVVERRIKILSNKGLNTFLLDGRSLSPGVYYVQIKMPDKVIVTMILRL